MPSGASYRARGSDDLRVYGDETVYTPGHTATAGVRTVINRTFHRRFARDAVKDSVSVCPFGQDGWPPAPIADAPPLHIRPGLERRGVRAARARSDLPCRSGPGVRRGGVCARRRGGISNEIAAHRDVEAASTGTGDYEARAGVEPRSRVS